MPDRSYERKELVESLVVQRQLHRGPIVSTIQHAWRHIFVPAEYDELAYADRPIPLDGKRLLTAPSDVAKMSELLDLSSGDRVLEIGTGTGYQTAVTADIVGAENVFSIDDETYAALAKENVSRLDEEIRLSTVDFDGIQIRVGDGREGWPEAAPFDAIYLTVAVEKLPPVLFDQVATAGRLLAPVGGTGRQTLTSFERLPSGEFDRSEHGQVQFAPLLPTDVPGSPGTSNEAGRDPRDGNV